MPSTSRKQHNMMAAVANNPSFAKKVGIDRTVGEEFVKADRKQKAFMQGNAGGGNAKVNRQNTSHGKMDMPFSSLKKFAGMNKGGKVRGSGCETKGKTKGRFV